MSVMFHFDSGVPSMVFLGLRLNKGKAILVKLSMVSKEVLASGQWRETGTLGEQVLMTLVWAFLASRDE